MNSQRNNKVKLIGVPMDLGTKKLGVDMGPTAMRYAGLQQALEFNNFVLDDHGDLPITNNQNINGADSGHLKDISAVSEKLAGLTYNALQSGYIPVVLGGDHSVSIGSIAGAAKKANNLGVLWLDCHPDANTPETSPSGNIHGMTIAISLGYGHSELVNCSGFSPKVRPESLCIIGAKDIDRGEDEFLKKMGVKMFSLFDIEKNGIVSVMDSALKLLTENCDLIHVSFDVDVLDPLIAPGTGIVSRGGLSYREITYIMESLGKRNLVSSLDVIEINPLLDIKNQTAELAIELILSALGGSYGDYQRYYLQKDK